jgi:hypothetical protein
MGGVGVTAFTTLPMQLKMVYAARNGNLSIKLGFDLSDFITRSRLLVYHE